VVTDPPYGMEFRSNHRRKKYDKIAGDKDLEWLGAFFEDLYRVVKNEAHLYIFCSFHHIEKFKLEAQKYFNVKNILIWQKNNTGMGDLEGDYAPQYEMVLYLSGGRKLNGRRDSNIIFNSKTGNEMHPTQKPVDLMEFFIRKSSEEGEIVFDPFLGSGTTARAASNINRQFIGIEISPEYCKIAEQRLKQQVLNF
jgi:site-specific DNA-methyltransferase (adenine-specific)